jgi:CSLREA domain-containing protein
MNPSPRYRTSQSGEAHPPRGQTQLPPRRWLLRLTLGALVFLFQFADSRLIAPMPSIAVPVTYAAVFSVSKTADTNDGVCDSDCSLREAIVAANASPGSTIILAATTYTLTLTGPPEDDAANGDLDIKASVTIVGLGADKTIINGNGTVTGDRVFEIVSGTVSLQFVTIRSGASIPGSGVYNHATLTLEESAVSGNSGAGILNSAGTLTLNEVTVSGNNGGGITNILSGTVNVNNSTISGNLNGSGVYNEDGTVVLRNVTITQNTATSSGGGIRNVSGTLRLKNTLVAGNSAADGPDCKGTLTSDGYNLVQNTSGCSLTGDTTGNITGQSPGLGSLQSNGGATQTHALPTGSPALDAGDPGGCRDHAEVMLTTDQRGVGRTQGAACDIGAYEAIKLRFNSAPYSRAENLGPATITVTMTASSPVTVTVNYATSDGAAIAGSDYTAISGGLTFTTGQTSKTFNISLLNDDIYEPNEALTITLSGLSGAVFDSPSANVTTLTILNDDTPRVLMPLILTGPRYFTGLEVEDNDSSSRANGPLGPNLSVTGKPDDAWDFFYFDATATGTITVSLPGYNNTGHQLQLYYQSTSNNVGYDAVPPYSLQFGNRPAGKYYVVIYTASPNPGTTVTYTLLVNYP